MSISNLNYSKPISRSDLMAKFESLETRTIEHEFIEDNSCDEEIVEFLNNEYYNKDSVRLLFGKQNLRNTIKCICGAKGKIVSVSVVKRLFTTIGEVLECCILCSKLHSMRLGATASKLVSVYALKLWPDIDKMFLSSTHNYDLQIHCDKKLYHLPVNDLLLKTGYCNNLPLKRMNRSYEYTKPTENDIPDMLALYDKMSFDIGYVLDIKDMMNDPYLEIILSKKRDKLVGWVSYAKKRFMMKSNIIVEYLFFVGGWTNPKDIFVCDVITFQGIPHLLDKLYLLNGTGRIHQFWINVDVKGMTSDIKTIS